jgi:hypothetical protein
LKAKPETKLEIKDTDTNFESGSPTRVAHNPVKIVVDINEKREPPSEPITDTRFMESEDEPTPSSIEPKPFEKPKVEPREFPQDVLGSPVSGKGVVHAELPPLTNTSTRSTPYPRKQNVKPSDYSETTSISSLFPSSLLGTSSTSSFLESTPSVIRAPNQINTSTPSISLPSELLSDFSMPSSFSNFSTPFEKDSNGLDSIISDLKNMSFSDDEDKETVKHLVEKIPLLKNKRT